MTENITYNPDHWIIIRIDSKEHSSVYKVLATWTGSYLWGSSWKISSGVEGIEDKNDHWRLPQSSGSVYNLKKGNETIDSLASSILHRYQRDAEESNGLFSIKRVMFEEFVKDFKAIDSTVN